MLIARIAHVHAQRLDDGIKRLFDARGTHARPSALPRPPRAWAGPYASLAQDVGLAQELDAAHAQAAAFLDPVLAGEAKGRWNPERAQWGGG